MMLPQIPDGPVEAGPAGWYVDPDNPVQSRRWDGEGWTAETGALTPLTQRLGEAEGTRGLVGRGAAPVGGLNGVGQAIYALAVLGAIAAVVGGWYLIQDTVSVCGPGEFDGCVATHPWRLAGIAVVVGGLLQSAVLGVVGYLCTVVDGLRRPA